MIGGYRKASRALALLLIGTACSSPVPAPISPSAEPGAPTSQAPAGTPAGTQDSGFPGAPLSPAPSGQLTGQEGLRLNEVRFAPAAGEPGFVEIANVSAAPIDVAGAALRLTDRDLQLANAPTLPAGGFLLVILDGLDSVEVTVIHGPTGLNLPPDRGSVELLAVDGTRLDRIAWGDGDPEAVASGPGGMVPDDFTAGSTIARALGANTPGEPLEWIASAAATPGNANPAPSVSVLLPLSGAILDPASADLFWYPVPGASSYRVQVATEATFASPIMDVTDTEPQLSVANLAPGAYLWRVQTISTDGTESSFSEPADFELAATGTALARASALAGADPRTRGTRLARVAEDTPGKHLTVPVIGQHKDTTMLLLEHNVETGSHPWDADHQVLHPRDPADRKNCAVAMIAMVSAFYGGGLSQDRIGYEVISHRAGNPPGPEGDLMYGVGISGVEAWEALQWAVGDVTVPALTSFDDMWNIVVREIDAGRPVAGANSHHAFVATGYEVTSGRRLITLNDPWPGRTYKQDVDRIRLPLSDFNFFVMPATPDVRQQEVSVTTDSDDDGVYDFDETQRFQTNPNDDDGDQDLLRDKQDIVTGVFDPKYGYAATNFPYGRDVDSDGVPTERDRDSDEGGCLDGLEDENRNGHHDGSELYNFNGDDDPGCRGVVRLHGTFIGHSEETLSTNDATFELTLLWYNPANIHEPLAFQVESGSFTFSTNVRGLCAGSFSEGAPLEKVPDNVWSLRYGDPLEEERYASATLYDDRADGRGLTIGLVAYFTLPGNGDPLCEPPYEPVAHMALCPLVFLPVPAATQDGRPTLETTASCDSTGSTWTGHLVEQ